VLRDKHRSLQLCQPPLRARVRNTEPTALRIALRLAADLRHHHGQLTALRNGIAHASLQQSRLQPAPAHLRNRRGPAEDRHSFMQTQRARGARLPIQLGEKTHTVLARRRKRAKLQNRVEQFGMFVRPPSRADFRPQLCFLRTSHPHRNSAIVFPGRRFQWLIQNIAELHRPVSSAAQQVHRRDPRQRTHLMHHRSPAVEEKALYLIERRRSRLFKESEPEALRDRRVDPVKDCVCACALHPCGAALRRELTARLCKLPARQAFGAFQTP
jgi:hypothetical protein